MDFSTITIITTITTTPSVGNQPQHTCMASPRGKVYARDARDASDPSDPSDIVAHGPCTTYCCGACITKDVPRGSRGASPNCLVETTRLPYIQPNQRPTALYRTVPYCTALHHPPKPSASNISERYQQYGVAVDGVDGPSHPSEVAFSSRASPNEPR